MVRLLSLFLVVTAAWAIAAQTQPNFLLIVADDLGWGDLSSTGAVTILTPTLDRLAKEGAKFTQWHAAAGLCTPSRGALLTGRLPVRLGLYTQFDYPADLLLRVFYPSSVGSLPANETTIASALRAKGYYSALIGKWHLGHVNSLPTQRGFNYFFGTPYSHDEGYPGPFPISFVWPPVPVYENEKIVEQPIDLNTITERMTTKALDVIDTSVSTGQPFFLQVAYHEPHIPAFATAEFAGSSRQGPFGDMVQQMDSSIGRIIDHITSLGLEKNTLVIFTSDNGAWPDAREPGAADNGEQGDGGNNGPFREGKGSTWDGGIRVPTIAWWPGHIQAGRIIQDIASHLDVFPTFLEFAGVELPRDRIFDGYSLAPLLSGTATQGPNEVHYFWREKTLSAIRVGKYKGHFVTRPGFGNDVPVYYDPLLLFNVEKDPGERFPLNVTEYPLVVRDLLKAAETHLATIEFPPSQFDSGGTILGQDWKVIPCCARQKLEREFAKADPPADWPLRLWKNCICQTGNSTSTAFSQTSPPPVWMGTYLGEPITRFQKVIEAAQAHVH